MERKLASNKKHTIDFLYIIQYLRPAIIAYNVRKPTLVGPFIPLCFSSGTFAPPFTLIIRPLSMSLFARTTSQQNVTNHSIVPLSFFKTLVDASVIVELKNDVSIRGTLRSVDQYLNIKLDDISVVEEIKYPHLVCIFTLFWE